MRNNDAQILRDATHAIKSKIVVQPKITQSFAATLHKPMPDEDDDYVK